MDSVVHFEIPADDVERGKKFYQDCFEWNVISMPDMGYNIFHTGKTSDDGMIEEKSVINGGMLKRQAPVEHINIVIKVDSIEDALKKIKANGGETLRERIPVGDMGFTAYFKDPEGNAVGLWEDAPKTS